jgi:hypothetical protein
MGHGAYLGSSRIDSLVNGVLFAESIT